MKDSVKTLQLRVARFRDEREWAKFHTPKNLAAAISIEAAELQEQFLWKTDDEAEQALKDDAKRQAVSEEVADIAIFTLLLADRLGIDLSEEVARKIEQNEIKYPVAKSKGRATKYTEL